MHVCPLVTPGTPPIPHVGGPVIMGAPTVMVAFMPQARVGDTCTCVGPPDAIAMGSPTVLVCGMPAARMGDPTTHGGVVVSGAPNVLIGVAGIAAPPPLSPALVPPICLQLAQALAENAEAQDMALLAEAAYGDVTDEQLAERGMRRATPDELRSLGLVDPDTGLDMTRIEGSNFRSEVFVRGDEYVVGFKGTTMTSAEDWDTNARQGLGQQTAYYDQATEIGMTAEAFAPGRVRYTGHSLGGGLASAASAVSGGSAHTFNAAGLHPNTVQGYSLEDVPVQAYYVEGDILSSVQDSTLAPDAVGTRRPLAPARDSTWTDYAGGVAGGLLGALKGGVWAGAGAAGGHAAARGGRLHMMASVNEALAAEADALTTQAIENGCP
jgi:uncharacterized Zn-binding protein involved in type VI secretion